MMKGNCLVCYIVATLVIVGALNWGLIGLFEYNFVNAILGGVPVLERFVYILVGLAGVMMILKLFRKCPLCKKEPTTT